MQHVKVPRLGFESELELPAYATATATPNRAAFVTCPQLMVRSFTHRVRPEVKPASSWALVTTGTPAALSVWLPSSGFG